MPGNTSATGGPLLPDGNIPAPLEGDALDDLFGDMVAGLTGLDRDNFVRPRWQPEPPPIPDFGTDWVAVGVMNRPGDTYSVKIFDPYANGGDGAITETRHEGFEVQCSFYGPNATVLAALLRDGLAIDQNREDLKAAGLELKVTGDLTRNAELIKNRWLPRCDVTMTIRRAIAREYAILTILSAEVSVQAGGSSDNPILVDLEIETPGGSEFDFQNPDNIVHLTAL